MDSKAALSGGSESSVAQGRIEAPFEPLPARDDLRGTGMLKRAAGLALRGLGIVSGLAAAVALIMYLLAFQALHDLAVTPGVKHHASAAGGVSVAAMHDGSVKVRMDDGGAMELGGHMAPIKSTEIVGSGAHLMTADATGNVRFTVLGAAQGLHSAGLSGLSTQFYDAVWRPYGVPVARWSLDWVAQVLPLYIPESRKGGRGRVFRDCDVCPEMVEIEPGMFFMGSPLTEWERSNDEGPRHLEVIRQRFAVGRFEVTFDEWDACVKEGGCKNEPSDEGWDRGKRPVINVSWDDAQEYVAWLSKKVGKPYRPLTDAEWEYAARAGTTTPFSTGQTINPDQANFKSNTAYGGNATVPLREKTIEVGLYKPNAFGLYDMHGNVWERVEDCHRDNDQGSLTNGPANNVGDCSRRILRGGSWDSDVGNLRSAYRDKITTGSSGRRIGFRVAKTIGP